MKSIYVKNLLNGYFKKKKIIVIFVLVFVLVFGYLGMRQAYPEKVSSSLSTEVQEYEAALKKYDDAINEIQENIDLTETQVEKQQKYCDESVFMQIDSSNVQVVSQQYMIKIPNMDSDSASNQLGYILNAFTTYVNSGSLQTGLASEIGNISTEYLSELISTTVNGNILTVTVKHSDMDQAKSILEKITAKIDDYYNTVVQNLGSFDMEVIDKSELSMADVELQNKQNNYLNALRTYKNTLSDLKTKLVSQQNQRNTYVQQYKPAGVSTRDPKETVLAYGVFGILFGLIVSFGLYAIWYSVSGKVKNHQELLAADVPVLATYSLRNGYAPSEKRLSIDLQLLAEKENASAVNVSVLGKGKCLEKVVEDVKTILSNQKMDIFVVKPEEENAEELQHMIQDKNCVLLVESGKTSYMEIEEQLQFCKRFYVSVWGCIVIE